MDSDRSSDGCPLWPGFMFVRGTHIGVWGQGEKESDRQRQVGGVGRQQRSAPDTPFITYGFTV